MNFFYNEWKGKQTWDLKHQVLVLNLIAYSSQCYKEDGTSKNPDCPVCSKSLNKLAQPLPMAHCANSRLVCKISGEVMNENNPPMMLPNGYVYGYNVSTPPDEHLKLGKTEDCSLLNSSSSLYYLFQSLLSIRQDDKVVCPRTKEVFNFSQAEKVYIMWSVRWAPSERRHDGKRSFITCDLPPVELWSSALPPSPHTHTRKIPDKPLPTQNYMIDSFSPAPPPPSNSITQKLGSTPFRLF